MHYRRGWTKLSLFLLVIAVSCSSQKKVNSNADQVKMIDAQFKEGSAQYMVMKKNLPPDQFPKTYEPKTDKFVGSGSDWWCSGFYPGTLLYLYEQTKEESLYTEALRILKLLEKEKYNKTTHDLGFMMFCSFGNANRIAPKQEYNEILLTSAKSLSTRFNSKVGCIKSWDAKPGDFLVIIDNMMNLELLFWATQHSGDSSFYKIALTHANTTMKNHFRADNSSYHVLNYDSETGAVKEKKTAQGFADESAWARGQAWGLYGYTVMYRVTKDKKYLDQARKIAEFLLNHPNLPADKIPYWDFNAPDIPNALRDASAAAIIASALLELGTYVEKSDGNRYTDQAAQMIKSLSASPYKASPGTNGGFIIQHCVGHMPNKTEIDVPLTYADYYFVEALNRYKSLLSGNTAIIPPMPLQRRTFSPGEVWTDLDGSPINAHGGGILHVNNKYYWFGEKRGKRASEGVNVYSSENLYDWKFEGLALAQNDADTTDDIARGCLMERPKVIFNPKTKKYVMWFHLELRGKGYSAARAGVAVSDKVTGPYRYVGSFRPNGNMSRDMTLFVDEDGSAYHIYSSRENYDLRIAKLNDDFLSASSKDSLLFSKHREAPAVFKHDHKYYLITSGCTGWTPNKASVHESTSLFGPWKYLGDPMIGPNADSTFGGQSTYAQQVIGKENTIVFMADRWNPKDLKDSRYLWLPIRFKDGIPSIEWQDGWALQEANDSKLATGRK